ncbi:putative ubiquitin-conjugating enzyme E2 38 [Cornus florida]|uniref:putative ubiquitin-conjugating enzyme E2 38 n=1 Tax=Cornus florida TaxID=4283 RepID=UPI00289C65E5|nr:putative ubiquitin-conjugating enzyme E2 38 [Cornus florida]
MDIDIDEFTSQDTQASISKKHKHIEEALVKDIGNSTSLAGSKSGAVNSENCSSLNSDLSYHDDNDGDGEVDDGNDVDDVSDYDDNDDYMFDDNGNNDDDDYLKKMQDQFDNVDLPPGVEASISWLKEPVPHANVPASMSTSSQSNTMGLPTGVRMSVSLFPDLENSINKAAGASSSTVSADLSSDGKEEEEKDDVLRKYELFKRFDTVDDFSDHHFCHVGFSGQQPPKNWTKKIQEEWKILEKDLPDTIYVRIYETRMDLLRAIIVGPAGTPYHDGLFVFDVLFPPNYPDIPPMVYYYSGGLRLNPNLYDCGKVCLSLLNTWTGKTNEMWMPKTSTMLQVLVSIQALILNDKPFFNEPGYEKMYGGPEGEKKSTAYNEEVFILSLKTMVYTMRRPPKHFEDLVAGHFLLHAHDILSACKAYMEGAQVGSVAKGSVQNASEVGKSCSMDFKQAVAKMINGLVANFCKNGSKDCEQFRLPS